jgi:uncharacterized pyridoxamine 5'-phosphate oxidase family protein
MNTIFQLLVDLCAVNVSNKTILKPGDVEFLELIQVLQLELKEYPHLSDGFKRIITKMY